jgi:hypothetical protein
MFALIVHVVTSSMFDAAVLFTPLLSILVVFTTCARRSQCMCVHFSVCDTFVLSTPMLTVSLLFTTCSNLRCRLFVRSNVDCACSHYCKSDAFVLPAPLCVICAGDARLHVARPVLRAPTCADGLRLSCDLTISFTVQQARPKSLNGCPRRRARHLLLVGQRACL